MSQLSKIKTCQIRILGFITISLVATCIQSTKSMCVDFGSGLTAIEDGDDRLRPAAVLHLGTAQTTSRFYVYGRDYGPVKERNYLLASGKRFDIGGKSWQGIVGLAGLYDTTTIQYSDHPEDNMTFNSTNFGAALSLHWNFFDTKHVQFKATWDALVFPAGSGFIFLANARRSGLGLTAVTVF